MGISVCLGGCGFAQHRYGVLLKRKRSLGADRAPSERSGGHKLNLYRARNVQAERGV